MLDPRLLRSDLENTATQLARRGYELDKERLSVLEARRKELQVQSQELQNERNTAPNRSARPRRRGRTSSPCWRRSRSWATS